MSEIPKPPFRISSVWRLVLPGRDCDSQEWIIREKRKGHFPPLRAFHSALQVWSHWVFLTLSHIFKTSVSSTEGFCICTSWSQVTKSLQSLLCLIVSFWLTQLPFTFAFLEILRDWPKPPTVMVHQTRTAHDQHYSLHYLALCTDLCLLLTLLY